MAAPTTGAMIAAIASEWAAVDTAKLYWDNTNTRLGIGDTPGYTFDVADSAAVNDTHKVLFRVRGGTDTTLGTLQFIFGIYPSATGASRYVTIAAGDAGAWRNIILNPTAGNVGVGITPTEKLHVDGNILLGANGTFVGSPRSGKLGYTGSAYACVGYNWSDGGSSTYVYGVNDFASIILFAAGGHYFYQAASGTAGNTITWSEKMRVYYADGHTYTDNGLVYSLSDETLKTKISDFTVGLKEILSLSPSVYLHDESKNKIKDKDGNDTTIGPMSSLPFVGLSAQDVQEQIPDAVVSMEGGYLGMTNGPIIYALVNAVKELAQANKKSFADPEAWS